MCAVWSYLDSTCVCVQICVSISRRCYFIKRSQNNILLATTYRCVIPSTSLFVGV